MKNKTKEIIYWLFIFCILCPVVAFGAWQISKFGAYLENYIGEVPSNIAVMAITFICGYGLKLLSELDKS